ncbi:unnamed protein product [Pieris brassicae]|uniref:Uncharacterized protein n=1 Tax=Pieris brassicae TaxID=7116 RepID=A0A9P0TPT8_PIEBR|nr:unnamed protein product [Pieris brassicae]
MDPAIVVQILYTHVILKVHQDVMNYGGGAFFLARASAHIFCKRCSIESSLHSKVCKGAYWAIHGMVGKELQISEGSPNKKTQWPESKA